MSSNSKNELYLILDIDDLQTKAVLIDEVAGSYRVRGTSQAQTTVDPPNLDVTAGVEKATRDLGGGVGKELWGTDGPSKASRFLCSSSTGGSLYMMVAGVIGMISGESAQRAALGAGALLIDVFSKDYPRPEYEMVEIMRSLKPDMFLLAGGTDGGAVLQVLDMARLIDTADVRPRFGSEYKLPVIYAGNIEARKQVSDVLSSERYATKAVDNVRPVIERENLGPAKEAIYDSFMQHVIIHSPGYNKLADWVDEPIVPTQAAIGQILYAYAIERKVNLLAVDIGGATTDVYSIYHGVFNRSLNADIGLTHGISNVMKIAGVQNIMRWIPKEMDEREVRNIIGNMMIMQLTSLTSSETLVQRAAAREAIGLAVEHHKKIASRLKGVGLKRTIADIFNQALEPSYLDMMKTQVAVGRGKVFTQSRTSDAALLLLDAFQPEGVTEMMIDRLSAMPHLGMLLKENSKAALEVLSKECLLRLGTCVAPRGRTSRGKEAMKVRLTKADGAMIENEVSFGELKVLALHGGERAKLEVMPKRGLDVGIGMGKTLETDVVGGEIGLILDARGRPLSVPAEKDTLAKWADTLTHGQQSPA
ncbi:glutamate mutase L [Candidatus Bathyarchaeota archaeon]|nr:glutamate mutase L [Candidatus Bathyarchaeota archaeon]